MVNAEFRFFVLFSTFSSSISWVFSDPSPSGNFIHMGFCLGHLTLSYMFKDCVLSLRLLRLVQSQLDISVFI
jgi:hypothetical protein